MIATNKKNKIDLIEKASAEAVVETETFSGGNGDTWKEKKIEVEEKKQAEQSPIANIDDKKTVDNSAILKVGGLILAIAVGYYLIKKFK